MARFQFQEIISFGLEKKQIKTRECFFHQVQKC